MIAASPTASAENAASLLTVMMLVTGVGTVADRDAMRIIEETLSLGTASVIVTARTAQTIIGGDGISHIGETLT